MWFRNIQIYRLSAPFTLSPEELHEAMLEKITKPCAGLDTHRVGWDSPLGKHSEQLVHAANGRMMICMRREERILPAAVIREAVDEKAEEIEEKEARSVGRKEKMRIKEEIIVDLLPRAFTRSHRSYAYIDPKDGWVVLDCSSAAKAEEILTLMRTTLGSFKITPLTVNNAPAAIMTDWVKTTAPAGWVLADECELKEPVENGGTIRIRGIDLGSDDIQQHINSGKLVNKLAIEWQERLACILADDLSIKRLKFLDIIMEEAGDTAADDAAARFDADFSIMSMELARFIPALAEQFGGIVQD